MKSIDEKADATWKEIFRVRGLIEGGYELPNNVQGPREIIATALTQADALGYARGGKKAERLAFAVKHFKECVSGPCDSSCKAKARRDMWDALASFQNDSALTAEPAKEAR